MREEDYLISIQNAEGILYGPGGMRINVGMSTCGLAAGAKRVYETMLEESDRLGLNAKIVRVGCIGSCYAEPLVEIIEKGKPGVIYGGVTPEKVSRILEEYKRNDISGAFALRDRTGQFQGECNVPLLEDMEFFRHQKRDAIENCGVLDPESIEEYILSGGYRALERALKKMTPDQVIEEIIASGLRGRGGAGFPTGLKWRFTRQAPGEKKYAICNGDEGDPGAFMNRLNAEGDPHKVLEGLIIAAYAIGADEGYIFVRAEKPLMAERLAKAAEHANQRGLLGANILGTDFSLEIKTILSAGAFVCGEETGMIAAIEGRRAMPRPRPPFPATNGLWGKPTVINNVETLAHVPTIIAHGPKRFAEVGTEKSKGTKVFCLTGKVRRSGAVEVPLGTSLRTLVMDIGGGPREGKQLKAIQTGGPSGGCLSKELLDLPLDYESLQEAGSIMGSGGVVVIDEDTCIVDLAGYFLTFTTAESCGKCTPCRIGLKRMSDIIVRITTGNGSLGDLEILKDLASTVADASLCALGRSAPNPVLTTLRYFREEYEAHISESRCPAGVCKGLIKRYEVDREACRSCGLCVRQCPVQAISIPEGGDGKAIIDEIKCIKCGHCSLICPFEAIQGVW
jgi:NADH:ubiquinone oxidoreductase subunit F (NADH-binding)/(2Fe-2S) ferredoxin